MLRERFVAWNRPGTAVDDEPHPPRQFEREEVGGAARRDARMRSHAIEHAAVEIGDRGKVVVGGRELDVHGHRVRQSKPRILGDEPGEPAGDQRRPDEQHHGEAHFAGDKHAPSPARPAAVRAAARLLERRLDVGPRHQQRGHDAARDGRRARDQRGETQDALIHGCSGESRHLDR